MLVRRGRTARILFLTTILLVLGCPTDKKDETAPNVAERIEGKPSNEELHAFWDAHLNRIVMEEVVRARYPVSEINNRYLELVRQSTERYGKVFAIEASTVFNDLSRDVLAGCDARGGNPVLRIFVPAQLRLYRSGEVTPQTFEVAVVVGLLHELEHLASGCDIEESKEALIASEVTAWDRTCRYAISALVRAGRNLDPGSVTMFRGWLACGQKEGPCFNAFIREHYSPVTRSYDK